MKLIDTGTAPASRNMAIDLDLLNALHTFNEPILHLYDWEGLAATYGHFANPDDLMNTNRSLELGYQLAKRPTGGGVIFHTSDFAFSVLVPSAHSAFSENTLDNYNLINTLIGEVIRRFSKGKLNPTLQPCPKSQDRPTFCMVKPTCYDLVIDGKKAAGAAQRRTKNGFLHQGSISLMLPPNLEQLVTASTADQMNTGSYFLLGSMTGQIELQQARLQLHTLMHEVFKDNNLLH